MNAERILVTGATGFTGGHLCERLTREGYAVRALVRDRNRCAELSRWGVEIHTGDLRDTASLTRAMQGIDIVYHIAALYRPENVFRRQMWETNVQGTKNMLDAAVQGGVQRFIHCSTVGVHGDIEHPPANEDAPLRPGDIYQQTKVEGERIARGAAERTGLPVTIVRPSGIYGPGDRRLLKLFRGVARRRFVVLGSGNIFYHLTYIDDLVEGFRLCGESAAAAHRTYILAGGEVTTLNELMALIAAEAGVAPPALKLPVWPFWLTGAACEAVCVPLGLEPPIYRRRVDFFTKSRAFDISRARAEVGYDPQVTLRDGIRRTLAWYKERGWL
jgi:nucleoside-diphosphate-sugar epimerase